jgi:hypothetical protein
MSNNPYRTMCADMLEAFDGLPCETSYKGQSRPIVCIDEEPFDRARALLDQPEPEGLTDAAVWDLADDLGIIRGHSGDLHVSFADLGPFARAALARFDHSTPQPPADGEVAELVEWVGKDRQWLDLRRDVKDRILRIADLLERQRPQPVAVSERLPGASDCDEQGRCWWGFEGTDDYEPCWTLRKMHGIPFSSTRFIPANALPTPENTHD